MNALEKKIPPLVQVIVWACILWGVSPGLPRVSIDAFWSTLLAITVLVIGILLAVAGVLEFRKMKTTVDPRMPEKASALVVSGVYSISRNPMYVGFALWLLALVIYLQAPLLSVGVLLFVLYMNRFQIAPEERTMAAMFGVQWESYKSRVRRWL